MGFYSSKLSHHHLLQTPAHLAALPSKHSFLNLNRSDLLSAVQLPSTTSGSPGKQSKKAKSMNNYTETGTKPIPDELEQWLAATRVLIDQPLGNETSHSNPDDLPKPSTSGSAQLPTAPEVTQWPPRLQRSKRPHELCVKPPNPLIRAWVSNKRLWRYRCAVVHKRVFELRYE